MPSTLREVSGVRNVPLTVENPAETGGDSAVTWAVVPGPPYWVEMLSVGGAEVSGLEATRDYRLTGGYRTDISPRTRLGLMGTTRKLQVISADDPNGRGRDLLIAARETV